MKLISCPSGATGYTVKAGDSLYAIAQSLGTTVNAILSLNPGLNPNALQVGQVICVPGAAPGPCPNGTPYVIRAGDTFNAIAARNGTSVQALTAANPGVNPNLLFIGQTICIPGGVAPPPPVFINTPCCLLLQPVLANLQAVGDIPIGGVLARAVAMSTRAFTVTVSPLPQPNTFGNFDAYVAVMRMFREGNPQDINTIHIRLVPSSFGNQPVVWAGSVIITEHPAAGETVEVRPLNSTSGVQGAPLLRGDLGSCKA